MSGRVPSCRLLANASKAALLRINSMDRANSQLVKSPIRSQRETVGSDTWNPSFSNSP